MIVARIITVFVLVFLASTSLWAQSFLPNTTSRYSGVGANLAPSNPLSMPVAYGGPSSDLIPITSGMLGAYMPTIPNLELGFQYFFGNKVRSGQASFDYLLPVNVGNNSVVFGEAHGNWWNFAQRPTGGASNRVDLSIGGGYRKILADQLLVGINGFYDTSRLFNNWYSSGGVGLEFAANIGSSDAVDLNANWYGDIFSSSSILNAFRNKGGSYDIEAGYSHAMFNQALDLRIKFAGYQFDTGSSVYGYKTGADLTTKDGMFMLRYEYGNDRINGAWNNIGAFVNIGFQVENVIKGESPFTMPEPIFKSPRNLGRMMAQKVKRDWSPPMPIVGARTAPSGSNPNGPWFRFTLYDPAGNGIIRGHTWGVSDTYVYVMPGDLACATTFSANGWSIQIEGYESHGATDVRMTVLSDSILEDGARQVGINFPTNLVGIASDGDKGPYSFTIPAGGYLNWPRGNTVLGTNASRPYSCSGQIADGAESGTLLLEDVAGIVPPQTIHIIVVSP